MTSQTAYIPSSEDFGVDFTVPILRTGVFVAGKHYIGLVMHRQFLDVCFTDRVLLQQFPLSHGAVSFLFNIITFCINSILFCLHLGGVTKIEAHVLNEFEHVISIKSASKY